VTAAMSANTVAAIVDAAPLPHTTQEPPRPLDLVSTPDEIYTICAG
jgi:hypothetical protein